jgi:spermidine/putrescine transport system substrate-binding protein
VNKAAAKPVRRFAIGVLALALAIGIAACGGEDTVGGANEGETQVAEAGPVEGELIVSTWPGYIDPGKNGTEAEFEEKTGVAVDWTEDINDNNQFFGKLQPLLQEGESGGRSIMMPSDWMASQMYDLGYLQELPHEELETVFENLAPQFDFSQDPDQTFSIPWQGGMTGIWVNTEEADEITSINDLFDPQYKGRVTVLSELRDTVPLVMRADGIATENATPEEWLAAIEKVSGAVESGQIRRVTGNEYTEDLTAGNAVASIGWSGDGYLIGRDGVEWRRPVEGCTTWFDTMTIPVGAPNTAAALEFMNYVYEPEVQADLAAFINYVTPVEGVHEVLEKRDPALAKSQLIFPSESFVKDCEPYYDPPGDQTAQDEVNEAWQDVVSGSG